MTDDLIPISAVAFMPPFPNPAPTDAKGELAYIDVRDLFIDPKYQRPVGLRGERNIRQVIENFSWSLFSPVIVGRRPGGKFAVIDGQHRAIAAITHGGIDKVPALIINGGPSDEAKAFSVINGAVTAISETQIWAARVVAGDSDAIRLQRILERLEITVPRSPKPTAFMVKGETVAIGAIESSFKKYGPAPLELALRTIVQTGGGNPGQLRAGTIKATTAVLASNADWTGRPDAVLKAIRTVGIKYLYATALRRAGAEDMTFFAVYSDELKKLFKKEIK